MFETQLNTNRQSTWLRCNATARRQGKGNINHSLKATQTNVNEPKQVLL